MSRTTDDAVERAISELKAIATLIRRPPRDDVELEADVADRLADAIETVTADHARLQAVKEAEPVGADAVMAHCTTPPALQARVEALEKVLAPFAEVADWYDDAWAPDDLEVWRDYPHMDARIGRYIASLGSFRAARSALTEQKGRPRRGRGERVLGDTLEGREPGDDPIHVKLRGAIEREQIAYLWTPDDAIRFTPRVLPRIYGDGRALFRLATLDQRPAYWVIRGCSTWGCGLDHERASGPDFGELFADILSDLEDAFGSGRCAADGSSLFHPRAVRIVRWCKCEECDDEENLAVWPMVDDSDGCSWSRCDWPPGFDVEPHPLSWRGNLLALTGGRDDG